MIIAPINAIASWEGYEYQGHVAIYTALKNMYDLLEKGVEISGFELQVEGEEDFSIRENGKYISLHQVKYGAISLDENDKFSFVIEILQNSAKYGYFHIVNGKSIPKDFVQSTLKYIETLFFELDKSLVMKKSEVKGSEENEYIILEKISSNTKKASIYNILNYVCEGNKDKFVVENAINKIKEELDAYTKKIHDDVAAYKKENSGSEQDFVYLATYEPKFSTIKEARGASYEVISDILKIIHPEWAFFSDRAYSAFVYDQVLLKMKERITDFHIEQSKTGKCIITYKELFDLIDKNYHILFDSTGYQYYKVLNSIKEMYENYPQQLWTSCIYESCKECSCKEVCNLVKQIELLNSKSTEEKEEIIHNLILTTPEPGKSNNLPSDNLINRLLLEMLDEIKILRIEKNNVIQAVKDGTEFYRLSLDDSGEVRELQERLTKELQKTADKSFIFECDVLITDQLNQKSFLYNGSNINVLEEEQLEELKGISSDSIDKIKMDCNKPKVIRLINREQAKGELK